MKTKLVLLFSFFCLLFSAQTYTFDYILTMEIKNLKMKIVEPYVYQIALNSKNNSYVFHIGKNGLGYIIDKSTNKKHQISILQNSENGKFIFNFLKSDVIKNEGTEYFSVKNLGKNEYLLQYFEKEKKKKAKIEIKVTVKENPDNLISLNGDIPFPISYKLEEKLRSALDPTKKYILEKYIFDYKNGYILQDELQNSTKVDIKIEVPEK